jgi:16S rRNA (guanine966-N2)-methyltransferase
VRGLLKEGGLVYAESGAPCRSMERGRRRTPDWLAGWELVRGDKAGMVFYHLLKLQCVKVAKTPQSCPTAGQLPNFQA